MALRWSAGNSVVAIYKHWNLSQNLLSRTQFACLNSLSSRLNALYKEWWAVPTLQLLSRLIRWSEKAGKPLSKLTKERRRSVTC